MFLLFAGGKFFIVLVSLPTDDQCFHHIENSQLICSANRLTGLCILGTLIFEKNFCWFYLTKSLPIQPFITRERISNGKNFDPNCFFLLLCNPLKNLRNFSW